MCNYEDAYQMYIRKEKENVPAFFPDEVIEMSNNDDPRAVGFVRSAWEHETKPSNLLVWHINRSNPEKPQREVKTLKKDEEPEAFAAALQKQTTNENVRWINASIARACRMTCRKAHCAAIIRKHRHKTNGGTLNHDPSTTSGVTHELDPQTLNEEENKLYTDAFEKWRQFSNSHTGNVKFSGWDDASHQIFKQGKDMYNNDRKLGKMSKIRAFEAFFRPLEEQNLKSARDKKRKKDQMNNQRVTDHDLVDENADADPIYTDDEEDDEDFHAAGMRSASKFAKSV
jgi:hypothetical protein